MIPDSWRGGDGGEDSAGEPIWLDGSGLENHASATAKTLPQLVTDAVNGHAVVRFSAPLTTLSVADNPSLQFGVDPFAVVIVTRWRNSVTPVVPYYGSAYMLLKLEPIYPSPGLLFFANYPQIYLERPAMSHFAVQLEQGEAFALTGETGLNDDQLRVLTVRRSARTELQLRVNGRVDARALLPSGLNVSAVGVPLTLGGVENAAFDGDLAEVVALAGPVTDDELQGLERFLMMKYGLAEP